MWDGFWDVLFTLSYIWSWEFMTNNLNWDIWYSMRDGFDQIRSFHHISTEAAIMIFFLFCSPFLTYFHRLWTCHHGWHDRLLILKWITIEVFRILIPLLVNKGYHTGCVIRVCDTCFSLEYIRYSKSDKYILNIWQIKLSQSHSLNVLLTTTFLFINNILDG
jgi:hypothetical protein